MTPSSTLWAFKGFPPMPWIIAVSVLTVTLWSGSMELAHAAPARLDASLTSLPLDLQPPLVDAVGDTDATTVAAFAPPSPSTPSSSTAIDSYGNPIDSLKPVDTPDGRKVVSAQGVQFEIPNYASGITEIKKPADDLLPPFVDNEQAAVNDTHHEEQQLKDRQNSDDDIGNNNNDYKRHLTLASAPSDRDQPSIVESISYDIHPNDSPAVFSSFTAPIPIEIIPLPDNHQQVASTASISSSSSSSTFYERSPLTSPHQQLHDPLQNIPSQLRASAPPLVSAAAVVGIASVPPPLSSDPIVVAVPNTDTTTSVDVESAELVEVPLTDNKQQQQQQLQQESAYSPNVITPAEGSIKVLPGIPEYLLDLNDPDIGGPVEYMPADDGSRLKVIAWDLLPPHESQEPVIITQNVPKRVVGAVDPQSNHIRLSVSSGNGLNAQGPGVVSTTTNRYTAGSVTPVTLTGAGATQKYTADGSEETTSNERIHVSLTSRLGGEPSVPTSSKPTVRPTQAIGHRQRGSVHYTAPTKTTTTKPTTPTTKPTTTTTTTTTTRRPTTTTTRRTTTTKPTTTTTTTTTTTPAPIITTSTPEDEEEYYRLENGDSYTLPSWLADIDDPDLDSAVTFVIPTDLHEYNHTVSTDLLPPLEPYVDLNNIHLPVPKTTTTTTTTTAKPTTTTRRSTTAWTTRSTTTRKPTTTTPPTTTTSKPYWVRTYETSPSTTTTTAPRVTNRYSTTHTPPTHEHSTNPNNFAHSQDLNRFNQHEQHLPSTASIDQQHDEMTSESVVQNKAANNPFLPQRNNGQYNPQPKPFAKNTDRPVATTTTTTTPRTTTTTSTTTIAPNDENPFDSGTVPPWLSQFDYPDVGPGVPFVYDPADSESEVEKHLLPPQSLEAQATETTKPLFVSTSPVSLNSHHTQHTPTSFTHQGPATFSFNPSISTPTATTTTTTNTATSSSHTSAFPSKVTIPLPSIQATSNQHDNAVTQPPVFFAPPPPLPAEHDDGDHTADGGNSPYISSHTFARPEEATVNDAHHANANPFFHVKTPSSTSNTHFAAPFDSDEDSDDSAKTSTNAASLPPSKTTFTKSDEGKVITTNVFLQAGQATKPTTFGSLPKDVPATASGFNTFGSNSFSTPSSFDTKTSSSSSFDAQGFGKVPATSSFESAATAAGGGKYTGGFGGSAGVLGNGRPGYAVQADGSILDPDHTYRPPTGNAAAVQPTVPPTTTTTTTTKAPSIGNRQGVASSSNANKYRGSFGGPPGVYTPYDNVKGGGQL